MIGRLIAIMFLSRDLAHRMHLKVSGPGAYATHMALGSFYESIVEIADSLAEAYQGRHEIIEDIPLLKDDSNSSDPVEVLQKHLDAIEKIRYTAVEKTDTALQNIIDEAVAKYLSTLYKLKNLK
jgi:DNA-binding ferritin-like protein